jgi:iron complex outermembrane receptor protein
VSNVDVSKNITDAFGIAFGAEARSETYQIFAGDEASYFGEGSNSFPGIREENARSNSRFNLGAYFDAKYDFTPNFLINATVRTEKYSDFGDATVWKVSSRYKFLEDKIILRGSVSTGFRAPSLHQIYAQSTQASFAGGTIVLSGLFNNLSSAARQLEIERLKPEKSTNITVGVGVNPANNFNISLDYYNINIEDRIVYSSSISSSDTTSSLYKILKAGDLASVQFFINGIETQTSGIDFVANYRNIGVGAGKLGISLSGNYTIENEIVGTPADPAPIRDAGATILNAQVISLLEEGRPLYKGILGFDYAVGKFNFGLYNTLFGPTKFQDLDNGGSIMNHIKAEFDPAVVTDLLIGFDITKKATFTLGVNNILNVIPKWDLVAIDTEGENYLRDAAAKKLLRGFLGFSGRYDILGYNGSQFSQLGTMISGNLSIRF